MHVCADSFYAFSARLLYMKFTNKVTEYDIPFSDIAMVLQILYHKLPVRTKSSWELKIAKCGNLMTCTCIIILFSRSVLKIFMYKPPIDKGKLIYTICSSHDIAEIQLKLALNINQSTNWHTAIKFENKNTTIYNYGLHEK
jgi:hypothetical protein